MKLEELLEQVAAWSQEGKPPAQYLHTALGWRYRSSPRRKRREVERGDTRVPVPVPDQSLLILFAVPHDLDARRWLPGRRSSASVPAARLARVVIPEPHPLDGVLQLSSPRGWARLGEQFRPRVRSNLRTFFLILGKSAKNHFTKPICRR